MTSPAVGPKTPLSKAAWTAIAVSVAVAALAGAAIAWQIVAITCDGGCLPQGVTASVFAAALAGVGVAVIGLLVARAFAEWGEIRMRDAGAAPD